MAYFIGIDYGSDSARAVLCDEQGKMICGSVKNYPRWEKGLYCDSSKQIYRQHPLDYVEVLEYILKDVVSQCPDPAQIKGIAMDATCSTPGFVDSKLNPLAFQDKYIEDPDAMFVMWKDHSVFAEAAEITALCAEWKDSGKADFNFACHSGSNYSPECYWAKILNVFRRREDIKEDTFTLLELCDFIPAVLTGCHDLKDLKASHCAASAKHLWSEEWGGFPPDAFFDTLDPSLTALRHNMKDENFYCDCAAGNLCREWADKLGLGTDVIVGVGNIDSYAGATAAGVGPGKMVMNIGTAGCFLTEMPTAKMSGRYVPGVFGQVDGGIRRGCYLYEVGMSAFGDMFAWLRRLLSYSSGMDGKEIMAKLTADAENLPLDSNIPIAIDSFNGRRSPDPNDNIPATLMGLRITTSAPEIYHALVQASAFAAKMNIRHLEKYDVMTDKIMAVGGIAQKSPFVMQVLADVTGYDINVIDCKDSCALGNAMSAAVASGFCSCLEEAQEKMFPGIMKTYHPNPANADYYEARFEKYLATIGFTENNFQ